MENSYVSHLECSITGKKYEANKIHGLSEAGRPLLVRYNSFIAFDPSHWPFPIVSVNFNLSLFDNWGGNFKVFEQF